MLRIVLPLIVAFLVAAGGASGIYVLQAKKPAVVAPDSGVIVAHDSSGAPGADKAPVANKSLPQSPPPATSGDSSATTSVTRGAAARPVAATTPAASPAAALATPDAPAQRVVHAATAAPEGVASETSVASVSAPPAGAGTLSAPGVFIGGRISKIFTAMPAKQAAKVLEQMADADVVVILGSVTDRKAADILSALPPQRAAIISKSVLARKGGGK